MLLTAGRRPHASQSPPTPARDVIAGAPRPGAPSASSPSPLPALTPDAQRLLDQLKQDQAATVDQLRALQLTYRDSGHADDAAAIAATVRQLTQRTPPVNGTVTPELVHEGLPTRDEPVRLRLFRGQAGETLSFSIRGRDDQLIWGTTTYTDDSSLETAAVHAGLLRAGQSGIVKVRLLPGQEKYEASTQNGVTSQAYGRHDGSFRLMAAAVSTPQRTGSLTSYRDLVGSSIMLPVVGAVSTNVWGSDVYTDDSQVGAAAVHAGVLGVGEFGFVKVTLLPGQPHYEGSVRNGVTSQSFEQWQGSFRVESAPPPWLVQLPGGEDPSQLVPLATMRGHVGLSFSIQVTGAATGPVWGTGVYTDDSSLAAAAVHAGLLKAGEIGILRVTIAPGRQSYVASEQNGVKSQPYGPWEGSVRIERVK